MPDSGNKHPENRIHLYDPVGLLNDGYGGYRPSNYTVKPRRQTVSYDNFLDTTNNNNGVDLRSYNSITDTKRSYDSFEVDSFTLRSYNQSISSETINDDPVTVTTMVEDRNDGGLRFVVGHNVVEDDQSDAPTPRLWRPSSATSPKLIVNPTLSKPTSLNKSVNTNTSLNSLNSGHHNYQSMSANSRTQAIAKGRRELMDMVKDLPETFYELSLKDLVEQKGVEMETKKEIDIPEDKKAAVKEVTNTSKKQKKGSKKVKKSESKKKMVRSKSVDNGKFLLKTSVFPILGSRKSKKSLKGASSFKVAPMPKSEQTSNGAVKFGDKEWWKRKSCIASESSDDSNGLSSQSTSSRSSSSSSRSSSSNGRGSNRFLPRCCIFNGRRIGGKI